MRPNIINVLVVDPDGTQTMKQIDANAPNALQTLVGGWIEAIGDMQTWSAYLNEEGKLDGLPVNVLATMIAQRLGWRGVPGDVLVGTVVFCGPPDSEGYDTSLRPGIIPNFNE